MFLELLFGCVFFCFFCLVSLFALSNCAVQRSSWPISSPGWGDGCGGSWSQDIKQASGVTPESWAITRNSEPKLETFGAASVQRQLHTVVDLQNYDTMESQRTWSTVLDTIFSFYKPCPYYSFSHALNDRRSGHFTPESPKKRGSDLSAAALGTSSGFVTKEKVVCLHCTPHRFVQLASRFQKCLVWLQHWQKKKGKKNKKQPTSVAVAQLINWTSIICVFGCYSSQTTLESSALPCSLRNSWRSTRSSWPRCSALQTCRRIAPSPSAGWHCVVRRRLGRPRTRRSWPGPPGTSGAAGRGSISGGSPPPAAPRSFVPGCEGTKASGWGAGWVADCFEYNPNILKVFFDGAWGLGGGVVEVQVNMNTYEPPHKWP